MSLPVGIRLSAAIVVCMSWCLPTRAQETALPTERTAARTSSGVAAAGAVLEPTQTANWANRNGSVLSVAEAGTARQDTAPQAEPSPQGAPARARLHPPAKRPKLWTKARIAVLSAGIGMTGAGAYLWATGPKIPSANANCVGYYSPTIGVLLPCVGPSVWSSRKKAGLGLTAVGVPLSIVALVWH